MSKSTIDAMKQAIAALITCNPSQAELAAAALRKAIQQEEAQTVEHVKLDYSRLQQYAEDMSLNYNDLCNLVRESVVDAPAMQPLSGEREALITHLRHHSSKLGNEAADMLAADAQEIAELKALSVTNILLDVVPGDGSGHEVYAKSVADVENRLTEMWCKLEDFELAQQVAVPQPPQALANSPWLIRKVPNTKDQYFIAEGTPPSSVLEIYGIEQTKEIK